MRGHRWVEWIQTKTLPRSLRLGNGQLGLFRRFPDPVAAQFDGADGREEDRGRES